MPTITGTSKSRLNEFRKYTISSVFTEQYVTGGTWSLDGVSELQSNPDDRYVYFIGGVRYEDNLIGTAYTTTFMYASPDNSPDFITNNYYKNPAIEDIINMPKINNDVFIDRQELSAFDMNYKLEFIKNLVDINTYAGGNYFNIIKNS